MKKLLYIKQKRMVDVIFGHRWGNVCQRCGVEMKRKAKYCIKCRKIVDDELGKKYRAKK